MDSPACGFCGPAGERAFMMNLFNRIKKIAAIAALGCAILGVAGCFPALNNANADYQRQLKDQSIELPDEKGLTMESGMKLLQMPISSYLSDDKQAIFSSFTDEDDFQAYYDWYSDPQVIKEDFHAFCGYLCEEYARQKDVELTNVYLSIDMKMVYDYKDDTLYLSSMYKTELPALEKFQVQSVQELTFNEEARDYLVESGLADGIDKWINAPNTSAFFTNCPYVSIYNGELMTDFSKSVRF